ncbi:M14 family metallopeptidase [Caulobacter sp. 17J65-9]|nr:M14 family metallopeptidase [Caulobacter sp. 17J65-9]
MSMNKLAVSVAAMAVALGAFGSAAAQTKAPWETDILPPALAWHGKSEKLIAKPNDPWITPSETTGITATPTYAETRAFIEKLDAASPLLTLSTFGKSAQGRDMLVVYATKDPVVDGRPQLDPNKPVLLVQAGIHAGEIDGKDAGLMLLRDIAFKGKDSLLDKVNFVFVPIFNVDGHERTSPYSRPNQRGPVSQGWRTTAQNLNLNRDYAKADAPEMRAMIGLIRAVNPDLYIDLHVTDGIDYQYDVTFGYEAEDGRAGRSPAGGAWLDQVYRPAVEKALKSQGHIPGKLVFGVDDRNPDTGLASVASPPRFSTGYGDAIRVPTVLVENHSLKPYKQRVLGMYVLMEQSLRSLAADGAALKAAEAQDDARRPTQVMANAVPKKEPTGQRDFARIAFEKYRSEASGGDEVRWLGKKADTKPLPLFTDAPTLALDVPTAYWVPVTKPEVIERLKVHGVRMETLTAPRTVQVDMTRFGSAKPAAQVNEGHVPIQAEGFEHERRSETYPAGSVRVPTDQPLGELAVLLLEPQSEDSLFAWGFFPELLQRTEYIEGYAIAPLAERMLAADPKLKAEFEAKLKAEPDFAKDPDARLAWFYARTPYYDDRYLLYPVGREISGEPR